MLTCLLLSAFGYGLLGMSTSIVLFVLARIPVGMLWRFVASTNLRCEVIPDLMLHIQDWEYHIIIILYLFIIQYVYFISSILVCQ